MIFLSLNRIGSEDKRGIGGEGVELGWRGIGEGEGGGGNGWTRRVEGS